MTQVYGVTGQSVREEYFAASGPLPATGTRITTGSLDLIVAGVAASVNAVLGSKGIDPSAITTEGQPLSFAWLADTLRMGAAVRVARIGMLGAEADAVKSWATEFRERLDALRDDPDAWLPELAQAATSDVAAFTSDPEVTTSEPEFSVADEN